MTLQLELLPMVLPATLNDVQWPAGHPLDHEMRALAVSPTEVDGEYRGFTWLLNKSDHLKRRYLVEQMAHAEVVRHFNSLGGAQIRWDKDLGEYTTTTGDRYPDDSDVIDTVAGTLEIS